ncbi:cuticle protein 18.7 [Anthonomus grandis grandis]|uniref:cuticle protein 18.7 n=1 Tax=Anthonomus grandis grandis TaxID=2921223 RepID=UPI0021656FA0|nr:cuticle protein 18.7 [Anthonomus grandis grandis]
MQLLVVISCALAAVSGAYLGPIHIPVIGPNGVPVEPVEVQAARANHLAAVASGPHGYAGALVAGPVYGTTSAALNALPLDTPEVASAKIQHYRDFAVAAQRNGVHVPLIAAPLVAGPYPIDTPEVQLAKAAHFQAHAEASARAGRRRRDIWGGYHIPVIGNNGVPVDTPEVQAARASHLAALNQAAGSGHAGNDGWYNNGAYAEPYRRYWGPQATIGPNGQPLETPEVQAAKSYHFAAHAAVRSKLY